MLKFCIKMVMVMSAVATLATVVVVLIVMVLFINQNGRMLNSLLIVEKSSCIFFMVKGLDPVVQSVVSLTSSLRVISLTVLADSIYNILIFFVEKNVSSCKSYSHFFSAKNFSVYAYHPM